MNEKMDPNHLGLDALGHRKLEMAAREVLGDKVIDGLCQAYDDYYPRGEGCFAGQSKAGMMEMIVEIKKLPTRWDYRDHIESECYSVNKVLRGYAADQRPVNGGTICIRCDDESLPDEANPQHHKAITSGYILWLNHEGDPRYEDHTQTLWFDCVESAYIWAEENSITTATVEEGRVLTASQPWEPIL